MYYNHNLRTQLQEWKNRLYKSTSDQLGPQLKYLFQKLESDKQLLALINEACQKYKYDDKTLKDIIEKLRRGSDLEFVNEIQQAAYCFQYINYYTKMIGNYNLHYYSEFQSKDFEGSKNKIIENYISPILNFLHDRLDKSNSTIYLLERYKKRTEWFTKNQILSFYKSAKKNYEQVLEDDLRLFLFDQGIDYPFSTPKSASGRADIVGALDSNDPIVIEIKVIDKERKYGKNRIKDGFAQIVKYASDYNKDFGYLVIYNIDMVEINFVFSEVNNTFPPMLKFNNKTYYFVVINLSFDEQASNLKKIKTMEVKESDLLD